MTHSSDNDKNPSLVDLDTIQNASVLLGDGSKQLSDINVLLPLQNCKECRRAYKQMSATNGCYHWKVSHPSLVKLDQFPSKSHPNCANIAEVSSLITKESKTVVWLTAKDQNSQKVLQAQIEVAKIDRIEIFSRFRQLSRGDSQHLGVRAYDKDGSVFSTLDGFRFDWDVVTGAQNIRRIPIKDSHMKVHGHSHLEEHSWVQSDDFVLKAIEPGYTTLKVKILEEGYENVNTALINLTIVDPFIIQPKDDSKVITMSSKDQIDIDEIIRILPTSEFDLELQSVDKTENEIITFLDITSPNKKYLWQIDNSTKNYGLIEQNGKFFSKALPGTVDVVVTDQDLKSNQAEKQIHIVEPFALHLEVADVTKQYQSSILDKSKNFQRQLNVTEMRDRWVLVIEKVYLVKAKLMDKEGNSIMLTNNLKFESAMDKNYFELIAQNNIGSEMIVRVKKDIDLQQAKKTIFKTHLKSIESNMRPEYKYDSNKIRDQAEVTITGPVKIQHPTDLIILPYIGDGRGEIWELRSLGGSGTYASESSENSIASVDDLSNVKSVNVGKTIVTVRDEYNPDNFDTITVEVKPVDHLVWFETRIEAQRFGGQAVFNYIAKDSKGRKFTNCTTIQNEILFDVGTEFNQVFPSTQSWKEIKNSLNSQNTIDSIKLKSKFENEQNAVFESDLAPLKPLSDLDLNVLKHNNFGICGQLYLVSKQEGAARVKATFRSISSDDAEATSFVPLNIVSPDYDHFLSDLFSKDQSDQENQTFTSYHPSINDTTWSGKHFVLSFGGDFNLELNGGGNLWSNDYQVSWKVNKLGGTTDELLFIQNEPLEKSKTTLSIGCLNKNILKSHEYTVDVELKGKVSKRFLNPVSHRESFKVSCEPPFSQKLHWAQASTLQKSVLPKSRLDEKEMRTHFVLTNSNHTLRMIMLDKRNFASLNHQFISTHYTLTDPKLGKLHDTAAYDKKYLQVSEKPGTLFINSKALGYDKDGKKVEIKNSVTDQMKIEVVESVKVEPQFKSIHFNAEKNQYVFKIFRGSGEFKVTLNDTSVAQRVHNGREVRISPINTGSVQVMIEDIKLPNSPPAFAELLISDISRLELDKNGFLIEQASSLNMLVTAFDSHGNEFDRDQYAHMELQMDYKPYGVQTKKEGLKSKTLESDQRTFMVTGVEPGYHNVWVTAEKKSNKESVTSKGSKIQVFSKVKMEPSSLLLTPNMRYTINVIGGPIDDSEISSTFEFKNKEIATIQDREITALNVGETTLIHKIRYSKNMNVLSQTELKIRVELVTSIEIPQKWSRAIYKDSLLKQVVILKYQDENFSHGIAPISYDWSSNDEEILRPYPSMRKNEELHPHSYTKVIRDSFNKNDNAKFVTQFNSSSIYVKAENNGDAQLSVRMAIEYPKQYKSEPNWFSTSSVLKVQEKLSIAVPQFIADQEKQTHLFMLPPKSMSRIITTGGKGKLAIGQSREVIKNGDQIEYRDAPILELVDDQVIRTLDKPGRVTLIIQEANQAFGDQMAMLNVQVTDIFSLSVEHFHETVNVPIGHSSKISVPIKFQNEHAHLFANKIEGIEVDFQLSHPQVISAELDEYNSTITLKPQSAGECNVLVYLRNDPKVFDIFRVNVATIVQPSAIAHLHLGSEVNFTVEANKLESFSDLIWSSSNSSVLIMDSITGTGVAQSIGTADIMLSGKIVSSVQVSKIESARVLEDSSDLVLNVNERKNQLKVKLRLDPYDIRPIYSIAGKKLINQNLGIDCESEQPEYVLAKGSHNGENFYCKLDYVGSSIVERNTPRTVRINVFASGVSKKTDQSYKKEVLTFDVELTGNMAIISPQNVKMINLGQNNRKKTLRVLSLADIQIEKNVESGNRLEVKIVKDAFEQNMYEISIRVPESVENNINTEIQLKSKIPGSIAISLKINYDNNDRSAMVSSEDFQRPKPLPIKTKKQDKQVNKSEPKTFNIEYEEAAPVVPPPLKKDDKSHSTFSGVMVLIILVLFGLTMFDSGLTNSLWQFVKNSFSSCFRDARSHDLSREYYSARGSDNSGIRPARGSNPYFSPSQKQGGLRDPRPSMLQSRGSVMSVKSRYDGINDSIYRPSNF